MLAASEKPHMTENEYWLKVKEKYLSLVEDFRSRYERSINPEFLHDIVLGEIRKLWCFTEWRRGYNAQGQPVYDGGRLSNARLELQDGNRNFHNKDHLELDAFMMFEKYLEGDQVGVETYHLGTTLRREIKEISDAEKLKRYLLSEEIDNFFEAVQVVFADIPYDINKSKEGYFHSHLHLMLRLVGFEILSEVSTNVGRIDSVIELSNIIYLVEFKIGSEGKAIEQIYSKKYYQKYQTSSKRIILIGVNCSETERNIIGWRLEKWEKTPKSL
ncbi:MAG: PD-(D/E)XK nuclease domain-containing protein [Saprospiraceae bacterium]